MKESPQTLAIVSPPSGTFAQGLTVSGLGPPEPEIAGKQHVAYCLALEQCGLKIVSVPADAAFPDGTFVEDAAVITPETAVLCRSGAVARREEPARLRGILEPYREVRAIESPGTMDGGDVLRSGTKIFVGLSARTNREGAKQLRSMLEPMGYEIIPVPVGNGLHLKSFVNHLDDGTLIATKAYSKNEAFSGLRMFVVPDHEAYAANCLFVNGKVLVADGYPNVLALLDGAGYTVIRVPVGEFRKMDGGLTCLSLLL